MVILLYLFLTDYFLTSLDLAMECDKVEEGVAFMALALANKLLKLWQ